MKFQAIILLISPALAASRPAASAPDAVTNSTTESPMSPQDQCTLACDPSDVACRANCNGVPNPSGADIQKHSDCSAACSKEYANNADGLKSCNIKCSPLFTPTATSAKPSPTSNRVNSTNSTNSPNAPSGSDAKLSYHSSFFISALALIPFLASYL
ncbi:hypothetical protein DSO57_1030394 [Entomophthora muscae]|uniref:Uncharacterized protein n=1 Tax=Entomophthora muscae TaxID=34485 RepID=A0ACC2UKU4_9FUNG|nr:hypothetical protein DSO57_1030394 [Entomophthora muscae]